jgi:heptosyltransferase-1
MAAERVLVVRMGAMGDVIHALPAATWLKRQGAEVTWVIEPRWRPLLAEIPAIEFNRRSRHSVLSALPQLRGFSRAYDLQGLIKSAVVARWASGDVTGFADPRESPARWLYAHQVVRPAGHVVDQYRHLVGASGPPEFPLPVGRPEGRLPDGPFVLASPEAGWRSKQWPREYFDQLRSLLPWPLVLNGPPGSGLDHESSIEGLIDATRRAHAVIGVDSGPLHLAAALGKPGVAIFGPTDPGRNGPYGGSMTVLRDAAAITTYRRGTGIDPAMRAISPGAVWDALKRVLEDKI